MSDDATGRFDFRRPAEGGWGQDILRALARLTRLPTGAETAPEVVARLSIEAQLRGLRAWPVAGALVGFLAGLALLATEIVGFSGFGSALVGLGVLAWLVRAEPDMALARFAHGQATGNDDTSRRAAMTETVGPMGLIVLFFVVGLKLAALASLSAPTGLLALVVAVVAGRTAMVIAASRLRPLADLPAPSGDSRAEASSASARPSLSAAALAAGYARPTREVITTATLLGAAIVLLMLGPLSGVLALSVAIIIGWLAIGQARNAIGGYNETVLAAIAGLVEAAVLVSVVIL